MRKEPVNRGQSVMHYRLTADFGGQKAAVRTVFGVFSVVSR